MYAQVLRTKRLGNPIHAFQTEIIPTPEISDREVLVAVMAAGVNFNNVWAAIGKPINVIEYRKANGSVEDFHIGGSDASGIVIKKGKLVNSLELGEEVVLHAGHWDIDDPWIRNGGDPILSATCKAWGYETNFGSFAQFAKVYEHQCLPKPKHLSWEEGATYMLSGATAYRMLTHWRPNDIKKREVALIWGGTGGIGVMAIQLVREFGGIPIAVVNDSEKVNFCKELGALGVINRNHYSHWGVVNQESILSNSFWKKEVSRFESELLELTNGISPSIVIEHPGEKTFPTSLQVCIRGGERLLPLTNLFFQGIEVHAHQIYTRDSKFF
jgi:crotonyl-CoA carboxylase/reductase